MFLPRKSLFIGLLLFILMGSDVANAQLTVLSSGNTDQQWRDAQVTALKAQIAQGGMGADLEKELKARVVWLSEWTPKQLSKEPKKAAQSLARLEEPSLDPDNRATPLRNKLFGPRAKPTSKDTKALEKLLAQYPSDIGVRQLHLHWLDQRQYRKTYPKEIADAAQRLIGLLDQVKPSTREVQLAKAFCLYRRGRALVYQELPDVVAETPIQDLEAHEAQLQGTYSQLTSMVGVGRPEFILLEIRMLRRDGWFGQALELLESNGEMIDRQWYLKKRRDLLEELGWETPANEAARIYAEAFPEQVAEEKAAKRKAG